MPHETVPLLCRHAVACHRYALLREVMEFVPRLYLSDSVDERDKSVSLGALCDGIERAGEGAAIRRLLGATAVSDPVTSLLKLRLGVSASVWL